MGVLVETPASVLPAHLYRHAIPLSRATFSPTASGTVLLFTSNLTQTLIQYPRPYSFCGQTPRLFPSTLGVFVTCHRKRRRSVFRGWLCLLRERTAPRRRGVEGGRVREREGPRQALARQRSWRRRRKREMEMGMEMADVEARSKSSSAGVLGTWCCVVVREVSTSYSETSCAVHTTSSSASSVRLP